jgi:hypothetical protein
MCTAVVHNRANSCSYSIADVDTNCIANACTYCRPDFYANI